MTLTIEERIRLGCATQADFQGLSTEDLVRIKSDSEHTHYRGCASQRAVGAPEGYAKDRRILRVVASTEDKDHYGDRISVRGKDGGRGWLTKGYNDAGGAFLWSHNIGAIKAPIGQALKTWRGKIEAKNGDYAESDSTKAKSQKNGLKDALLQDVEFYHPDMGPDEHFKLADTAYLLMSGKGTPSGKPQMGVSVGFVPVKAHFPENKEERDALGLGVFGLHFREQVLLENSATPTPANPFATVLQGAGAKKTAKSFEEQVIECLRYMEDQGIQSRALLNDFRKFAAFGPDHAEEQLQERLSSRFFIFDKSTDEEAPDGVEMIDLEDEYEALAEETPEEPKAKTLDEALDQLRDALDLVEEGEVEADDDEGKVRLTLTPRSVKALHLAYEAADSLSSSLGVLVDAIDKNTDPDFESSYGDGLTLDEMASRLRSIEAVLSNLVAPSSKTTEPTETETISADALIADLR